MGEFFQVLTDVFLLTNVKYIVSYLKRLHTVYLRYFCAGGNKCNKRVCRLEKSPL